MAEKKAKPKIDILTGVIKKKKKNKYAVLLNRNFKAIAFLLAVIILILGYITILVPKYNLKMAKADEVRELKEEVARLQVNSEFLSRYSSQLINFTPEEERQLSLALPSEFDLSSIVVQLSKLASDHKFVVESISANEVNSSGLSNKIIRRIDIGISVNGVAGNDYGNFYKFIEALESSIMIFDVRAISFMPNEIGYDLELSTYYYPKVE